MDRCAFLNAYIGARRRFCRLHGEALVRFQDERARLIVTYAARHSQFYRDLFAGHDLNHWTTLPTVNKAAMMAQFDTFNTRGIRLADAMSIALQAEHNRDFMPAIDDCTVGLSSGTSGHRGLFLVSPAERQMWAGFILARGLHALPWRGCRIALFLRSNSSLYKTVTSPWISLRYFDLTTPIETVAAALNEFQPAVLVAPPSMLSFLADARRKGVLRIQPQRLISVAEVLEPQDKADLQATFERPVHEVYQCTEGLLAISCAHGSLHLQEDLVAVQLEPAEQGTTNEGQRWTPVVTDLWRRTQPIIRYRLNDLLVLNPSPCPCGSAFRIALRIEGRCDDVCYVFDEGGRLRPVFPDTLRRIALLSDPRIVDYQVLQDKPGQFRFNLALAPAADLAAISAAVRQCAANILGNQGIVMPDLRVERGLMPVSTDSKRRRVRCINRLD